MATWPTTLPRPLVAGYAIAPVEWAWRSLIARRALPIGKRSKAGDNREAGVIPAA